MMIIPFLSAQINGTVDSVFSQVGDIPTSFINTYVPPLVKSITDNIDTVQLGISNLAKQLATVVRTKTKK